LTTIEESIIGLNIRPLKKAIFIIGDLVMLMNANRLKWPIFTGLSILSIAVIILAFSFSKETAIINETRTVQPPPTLSSPIQSSISGTVKFDSTSTNSFNLEYPGKVHIDLTAGHYGVGATITDSTGSHLLDLSFNNILGANNPNGEFTGNPGIYNITISGPSSLGPAGSSAMISYGLNLTKYRIITYSQITETIPIAKQVRDWTKFCLILVPSLVILLLLALRIKSLAPKVPVLKTNARHTYMPPHLYSSPEGKRWEVPSGGLPGDPPPPNTRETNETYEYQESDEIFSSRSFHDEAQDLMSKIKNNSRTPQRKYNNTNERLRDEKVSEFNKEVDDLVKERKLEIDEAIEISRDISNSKNKPHFIDDTYHRLWAIRRRPSK
jgi:hypothetical protein